MLSAIFSSQKNQFKALAQYWLDNGAETFSLWEDGQLLAQWPPDISPNSQAVTACLQSGRTVFGEFRLTGLNGPETRDRLQMEAGLVTQLIKVEDEMDNMTAELVESQDQILALYNLTQTTRSHLDIVQTFQSLAKEVRRLIKAEAVFIVLDILNQPMVIEQYPAAIFDEATILYLLERLDASGQQELLLHKEDAASIVPTNGSSLLLNAISIRDDALAILGYSLNQPAVSLSPTMKLSRAIADHIGAQIENVLLHQETLDKAKLETELEVAAQIQLRLQPQHIPQVPGLDLAASSRPALHVGGDFYDFIDQPNAPFTFLIGDVSGKGSGAALLMAMTRSVFRSKVISQPVPSPAEVFSYATQVLFDDFVEVEMFVSTLIGQYDPVSRQLSYANAGHSPVIYCPAGGSAKILEADGPVMGALPTCLSENFVISFGPGDLLILATDGFSEATSANRDMFGTDSLLRLVEEIADKTAGEILDAMFKAVKDFSGDHPQHDDQTLVVVKGVPPRNAEALD
ncbi:MAG: PP2C family protein-serine/threonine phosphatase [Anaerolineae bacterium]|nr:PP2C family protein-serine/threonine phosphatase [Anaerolineae bacterium]